MKKLSFCLAAITLTLAGCSNNEIFDPQSENPNAISLDMYSSKVTTRATDANMTVLGTAGLKIYAQKNGAATWTINGETYFPAATGGVWENPTPPMWPLGDTDYPMSFFGISGGNNLDITTKSMNFTVAQAGDNQVDLLAGAATANIRPVSGMLPVALSHTLSKVAFKITAGKDTKLYIQSIRVVNPKNQSVLTFASDDFSWSAPTGSDTYTFSSNATDQIVLGGASGLTTDATYAGSKGNALMLMPQTSNSTLKANPDYETTQKSAVYLEIVYRMTDKNDKDLVGYAATNRYVKAGFALGNGSFTWNNNKFYTYNIKLGTADSCGGILLEPNFVDDNGATTATAAVNPVTNKPILEGDPIVDLNLPIILDVTVADWAKVDSDIK